MAEVEEFERRNEEWHKPYSERMNRYEQAQARLEAASNKVKSLLPQHYASSNRRAFALSGAASAPTPA